MNNTCLVSKNVLSSKTNTTALNMLNVEELQALQLFWKQLTESDESLDYPCIKPHFRKLWIFFVVLYSLIGLAGALGNLYMIRVMMAETNFRRFVNYLLFNLCLCDVIKCLVVLPLSLSVLLLKYWWFKAQMCYAFPMIQTFPVIVSMLTYVLIALDRYFVVFHSSDNKLSRKTYAFLVTSIWVSSICLSMPLKAYVRYFDLGVYFGDPLAGHGLCVIGFSSDIRELNTAMFIVFFVLPVVFMAYLFVKTNNELKRQLNSKNEEIAATAARSRAEQMLLPGLTPKRSVEPQLSINSYQQHHVTPNSESSTQQNATTRSNSFLSYIDQEKINLSLFLKLNNCLTVMIGLFASCWAPLQCLMLITYVIPEEMDTSSIVDTIFVLFTLIGFLSAITNPALLLYQKKSLYVTLQFGIRLLRRFSASSDTKKKGSTTRRLRHEDESNNDIQISVEDFSFVKSTTLL